MAKPKKQIDEKQVRELAAINCSYDEMADVLDCDPSTLTRRFAQAIKKGRSVGKMSLKRKMWQMAMSGDKTMCIWLSKQMLGYTDKVETKNENTDTNAKTLLDRAEALLKNPAYERK